jgi:hypothetical protein
MNAFRTAPKLARDLFGMSFLLALAIASGATSAIAVILAVVCIAGLMRLPSKQRDGRTFARAATRRVETAATVPATQG